MIESRVGSNNPFIQNAERIRSRTPQTSGTDASRAPSGIRARLNFVPDEHTLLSMIDRALNALSMGRFWDRGSIINLLV